MVSVDQLCSLDGLIWLQSGSAVGALTLQHQTTVSRNQRKCAKTLGVDVIKRDGFWQIEGDSQLLKLERVVHQTARLKLGQGLRLEAAFNPETVLPEGIEKGWIIGRSRIQEPHHLTQLLEQRVIEAWITSERQISGIGDAIVKIPLLVEPNAVGVVVHRDLQQHPAIQELVNSLLAQQQPLRLHEL